MRAPRPPAFAALLAAAAVGVVGCARQGAPPGGDPDQTPPAVVATRPDTFAQVDAIDDPIRIVFSERISERPAQGSLDDAVVVSPRTGEVRVDHEGDALEVDLSTGVRPGLVYRVTLEPVVRDLFGNTMREPFEFAFTTGGEFHETALAGMILDRITGAPVEGAVVDVVPDWTDTLGVTYVARADTGGIYALRFLPPGRYRMTAYQDRDRDREVDPFEIQGERRVLLDPADTVLADVVVLPPDTTPAVLAQGAVDDSLTIRLTFDDYLDPLDDLGDAAVTLEPRADTLEADTLADPEVVVAPPPPPVERVLHARAWDAFQDSVQAVEDSLAALADTVAADTTAAPPGDTAAAPPDPAGPPARAAPPGGLQRPTGARNVPRRPGQERSTLPDGTPLPTREIVIRLRRPLAEGAPYEVTVQGVENINGLPGGGGAVVVRRPVPETPPDTLAQDTLAPDTLAPDTLPPDTAAPGAVPDTVPPAGPPAEPPPDSIPSSLPGRGGGLPDPRR